MSEKIDRMAMALNEAMPPAVKRSYSFSRDELWRLARAGLDAIDEPSAEPILRGAELVEVIRRACPVSTDVED